MGYRAGVTLKRSLAIAAVAAPPLILLGVGLTHPAHLSVASAPWWTTMHLLLVPLFPLLAVSVWVLLRRGRSVLAWVGRIGAVAFGVFYGTLDALSGVATGIVTQSEASTTGAAVAGLFATGKDFAYLGGYSLLAAVGAVVINSWLVGTRQWYFWIGAVLALGGSALVASFHIYFPRGTAVLLALTVGFALLEVSRSGDASFGRPPKTR
jgi:hypothetical protein